MSGMITITHKEYLDLLEDSKQLAHLAACGVDNWEGYSYYSDDEEEQDND